MNKNLPKLLFYLIVSVSSVYKAQGQAISYDSGLDAFSLQLGAGSQGVGIDLKYGITDPLAIRLGGSFLPVKVNDPIRPPGFRSTTTGEAKFNNVHLLADYAPFENLRWMRFVGGVGYLYKATGSLNVLPVGTYNVASYTISSEEMGTMNVDVSWKGVAPYLGLGFFKGFPSELFNINLDLGAYYLSPAKSTVVGTKLLSENYKLEPQIDKNLKPYRWLPVFQVNFNFKLK